MKRVNLRQTTPGRQSLGELWESLDAITKHVTEDNTKCSENYPVDIRSRQVCSLKVIIEEIEKHHK